MKPNFNNIDINDVVASKATVNGENWLTPAQIPVKPIYTKEDLEGLEHLNYASGIAPF